MEFAAPNPDFGEGPALTALGKRIEVLRIARGVSKQHLAHYAGTSRQQLWRVMTGKSELTSSLRERLAQVLHVEPATLSESYEAGRWTPGSNAHHGPAIPSGQPRVHAVAPQQDGADAPDLPGYLAQPLRVGATLRSLPSGEAGRRLKLTLLNELEELATRSDIRLTPELFELRRQVLAGEL